jgi:hypothetical protein
MNAAGRTPFEIWLNSGVTYKFALYTSTNVLIGTYDNIQAIDDPTVFNNLITVTGTNTLTGTSVPPYTSYVAGMTLSFIPVTTNTGAVTLDLDGLGAKNVFVGSSTALSSGDLVAGRIAQIQYDGTRFQLYQSTIADDSITTAKFANNAIAPYAGHVVGVVALANGGTGANSAALARISLATNDAANITTGDLAAARITTALNASGSAPIYAARAWVNFNGTGTVAIRASGNVSSITDNGTGDYTVNFTTGMSDANYAVTRDATNSARTEGWSVGLVSQTTSAARLIVQPPGFGAADMAEVSVAIHR